MASRNTTWSADPADSFSLDASFRRKRTCRVKDGGLGVEVHYLRTRNKGYGIRDEGREVKQRWNETEDSRMMYKCL